MSILYPGRLGTCFCFFFGTFACLIFTCAHTSHGSSFPVILIPMFSAVVFSDTFLTKIPIAPCYCQMMGRTLREEIKITQYNNPTKAGKYSLEDLFRASDNIPHHYPKF